MNRIVNNDIYTYTLLYIYIYLSRYAETSGV